MLKNRTKIVKFLHEEIAQAEFRAASYIFEEQGKRRPQRNIILSLKAYLRRFLDRKTSNRWLILTGLRGAGKTTLLAQIFKEYQNNNVYRLWLSLDQTSQILNISLDELIEAYEELIGRSLENLDKPLLLFLDEVQYDKK